MERKIGEIFEYNGEWYQCVVAIDGCRECSFRAQDYCTCSSECFSDVRSDETSVVFKKLEKVGEPFSNEHFGLVQKYELKRYGYSTKDKRVCFVDGYDVFIKIKQSKEDMEDLDKIKVRDYTKVEELNVMEENKLNLNPFDIQKAREGKPVCTRDGHKARIICFDRNDLYPIVALIECEDGKEMIGAYSKEGCTEIYEIKGTDLMMLPKKKEGWAKVRKDINLYDTKEEADRKMIGNDEYVTAKVYWEE